MERNIDKSVFMKPLGAGSPVVEEVKEIPEVIQEEMIKTISIPLSTARIPVIALSELKHTFDKGTKNEYTLFDGFNLNVDDIEDKPQVISIMGGSGCGKSCLLRIIAGLMKIDSGSVLIYGKPLKEYGHIPMVFQAYSNYEWMTVLENISLPMILKGTPKKEANERAMELIRLVGLEEHATKYAKNTTLSGGQLQRISIARCLASGSQIMLLDEATGALDIKMKREIQDLVLKICRESKVDMTILNVTHSIEEAAYISNKVVVLNANPCTIYTTMDIDYGEKDGLRGQWVFETPEFSNYSKALSSALDCVCSKKNCPKKENPTS